MGETVEGTKFTEQKLLGLKYASCTTGLFCVKRHSVLKDTF